MAEFELEAAAAELVVDGEDGFLVFEGGDVEGGDVGAHAAWRRLVCLRVDGMTVLTDELLLLLGWSDVLLLARLLYGVNPIVHDG